MTKLKITTKKKTVLQKEINWQLLPIGTVIEFRDSVRAVVFTAKDVPKLLLLTYSNGELFFDLAVGYEGNRVAKVLGTIEEIVVDPN